ncbi:MAG: methionyl-tRNA formyltransferase [Endomicrobium sp.]|nr:methionyl-tRNA formyltransferase [Endomicrobium sp.]
MVKILFFGTDSISKTYLEELYKRNYELFVVTMPDKPALRGHRLTPPSVKIYVTENNIKFIQPEIFTPVVTETIKNFGADIGIAVAYGKVIPKAVFNLPHYGIFNIHFSLLPKYRGAAPVQHALRNGETETGVTSFYIEEKLDTGYTIIQKKLNIDTKDNAKTLSNKLVPLGIEVMNKTLYLLLQNRKTKLVSQIGEPSFAPVLKKTEGLVDWNKTADEIYNQFRGLYLWPGIYSIVSKGKFAGKRIKFVDIEVFEKNYFNKDHGIVFSIEKNRGFTVLCNIGKILITKIQPENKPIMSAWAFIQGRQLATGDRF